MKQEKAEYKVNLIGESDLSKLSKDELTLLVAHYVKGLEAYLSQMQTEKDN